MFEIYVTIDTMIGGDSGSTTLDRSVPEVDIDQILEEFLGNVVFFAIFDENFYLSNYPDVAAAVAAGAFSSGREHFLLFGFQEGRVLVSPNYNERTYLERYPDVAAAVAAGAFSSGLDHYNQFGQFEGRSGNTFNNEFYLLLNPDVAAAVAAGAFSSGLDHYNQFGQFEQNRFAPFTGTSGNDVVSSFGEAPRLAGVGVDIITGSTG